MARIVLKTFIDGAESYTRAWFICPGCKYTHGPGVAGINTQRPIWEFNGNLDSPTFNPSVAISQGVSDVDGNVIKDAKGEVVMKVVCHSYVNNGRIQFLGDCEHALKGQTVDLPDIPPDHWLNDD